MSDALDLFQHWIMTEAGLSEEHRKQIMSEWIGVPSYQRDKAIPVEESWAPAWWTGDEDATMASRMAVMTLDAARNRR